MKSALIFALFAPIFVCAMPVKSKMLRPKAYFVEDENNLYLPLDLKAKTLKFGKVEFDQCGSSLVRKPLTLSYSCTLPIPGNAKVSKLQRVVGPVKINVNFAGTKREVILLVSGDAKTLTVSTAFDSTGIDFDVSAFNEDFFPVNAKAAQIVMGEALKKPLQIEVLESR